MGSEKQYDASAEGYGRQVEEPLAMQIGGKFGGIGLVVNDAIVHLS